MMTPRPVQQLVPAGDVAVGRSPDAGQRLIPADEQAGSPEPVESPARLEALVAALEAVLGDCLDAHSQISQGCTTFAKVTIARIERRIRHLIASERRRAATGGNDQGDGRRDGCPNSPPTSSPFHPPSC